MERTRATLIWQRVERRSCAPLREEMNVATGTVK